MSALKEAVKCVKPVTIKESATDVMDAVVRGRRMSGRMFGIEMEARDKVRRELLSLEASARLAEYFSKYSPLLFDMSCLEWRTKGAAEAGGIRLG